MTRQSDLRTVLAVLADRLESWAAVLPRWSESCSERWDHFLERQHEAEMALVRKLVALPGCELAMCPSRLLVRLTLLGIEVESRDGLARACQTWAEEARGQLERV